MATQSYPSLLSGRVSSLRLLWRRVLGASSSSGSRDVGTVAACHVGNASSAACHLSTTKTEGFLNPRLCYLRTDPPRPRSSPQGRRALSAMAAVSSPAAPAPPTAPKRQPKGAAEAPDPESPAVKTGGSKRASKGKDEEPDSYDASQIQVLDGLEPVRKRPGMYIGSTGQRGLHHLIYEVLDNSIDEVQAGFAHEVDVEVDLTTGWVCIRDDGRGIPTDIHPKTGKSALETVLTVLHAGGKFGGDSSGYKVSGGLHGVGISVVNALSKHVEIKVWRGGQQYEQSFSRGAPLGDLSCVEAEEADAAKGGTQVRFLYDDTIFSKSASFDAETIRARLRELAFLNSGATIRFRTLKGGKVQAAPKEAQPQPAGRKERTAKPSAGSTAAAAADTEAGWQLFHYKGGLREFVTWMNEGKEPLHQPIYFSRQSDGVTVEVALQWCSDSYSDEIIGFANSIRNIDGGTHIDGLRAALTKSVNAVAKKQKLLKEGDPSLTGDHIREGLSGIVSVKVPDPEFEGQTKTRLGNPEIRKQVDAATTEAVSEWLETNPQALATILAKAMQAAKAAEAAKKARELVRRKNVLTRSTLPGKLADCTSSNRAETEIFLVEGDSAGGSAKQARDRRTQAVLPLRGKILNVERKDDAALLKNNEIANMIVALGLGNKGEPLVNLRYNRVIILTDADVDGAHIRTLLLTFLFRFRRELFEQGHVYVAVPPLYKVELNAAASAAVHAAEAVQRAAAAGTTDPPPPPPAPTKPVKSSKSARNTAVSTAAEPDKEGMSESAQPQPSTSSASASSRRSSSSSSAAPGPSSRWCFTEAQLKALTSGLPAGSFTLQRFKGLGEMMPEQLWSTTLNPQTRQLRRLTIDDAATASHVFSVLMGDKVAPRRALIEAEGAKYSLEDLDV